MAAAAERSIRSEVPQGQPAPVNGQYTWRRTGVAAFGALVALVSLALLGAKIAGQLKEMPFGGGIGLVAAAVLGVGVACKGRAAELAYRHTRRQADLAASPFREVSPVPGGVTSLPAGAVAPAPPHLVPVVSPQTAAGTMRGVAATLRAMAPSSRDRAAAARESVADATRRVQGAETRAAEMEEMGRALAGPGEPQAVAEERLLRVVNCLLEADQVRQRGQYGGATVVARWEGIQAQLREGYGQSPAVQDAVACIYAFRADLRPEIDTAGLTPARDHLQAAAANLLRAGAASQALAAEYRTQAATAAGQALHGETSAADMEAVAELVGRSAAARTALTDDELGRALGHLSPFFFRRAPGESINNFWGRLRLDPRGAYPPTSITALRLLYVQRPELRDSIRAVRPHDVPT